MKDVLDDNFNWRWLCDEDKNLFEEYVREPSKLLFEMANLRGEDVEVEDGLPFSMYISSKDVVHGVHGIRVEIVWNPAKMRSDADGFMELHGDYKYVAGKYKKKPTADEEKCAREFFKKYKVLFAAVWENKLVDSAVTSYMMGDRSWTKLLGNFKDITEDEQCKINHCKTIEELEKCVRDNNIFNMND